MEEIKIFLGKTINTFINLYLLFLTLCLHYTNHLLESIARSHFMFLAGRDIIYYELNLVSEKMGDPKAFLNISLITCITNSPSIGISHSV